MHVTNSTWFQSSLSDATLRITICLLCFLLLFFSFTPTFTVLYTTVWHRNCLLNSNWCQWKVQYEHDPYDVIYNRDDDAFPFALRSRSNSHSSEPLPAFFLSLSLSFFFTNTNRCWKAQPSHWGGSLVHLLRFSSFPCNQNWPCVSRGVQTVECQHVSETFLFWHYLKMYNVCPLLLSSHRVSGMCCLSNGSGKSYSFPSWKQLLPKPENGERRCQVVFEYMYIYIIYIYIYIRSARWRISWNSYIWRDSLGSKSRRVGKNVPPAISNVPKRVTFPFTTFLLEYFSLSLSLSLALSPLHSSFVHLFFFFLF